MTEAAIAGDIEQTLDTHLHFRAQLTLYLELICNGRTDSIQLVVVPFMHLLVYTDSSLFQDVFSSRRSDTINIGETNFASFVLWQIHTGNTRHNYYFLLLTFDFYLFTLVSA